MIEIAATAAHAGEDHSRQQQDIALAAWILRSATLSERQLSEALRSWTLHGSVPLSQHLSQLGLLDDSTVAQLSSEASNWLAESRSTNSAVGNGFCKSESHSVHSRNR